MNDIDGTKTNWGFYHMIGKKSQQKYQIYMEAMVQYFKFDSYASLHNNLFQLVSRPLGSGEGEWKHAVYEFLVYSCLNAQGGFSSLAQL